MVHSDKYLINLDESSPSDSVIDSEEIEDSNPDKSHNHDESHQDNIENKISIPSLQLDQVKNSLDGRTQLNFDRTKSDSKLNSRSETTDDNLMSAF